MRVDGSQAFNDALKKYYDRLVECGKLRAMLKHDLKIRAVRTEWEKGGETFVVALVIDGVDVPRVAIRRKDEFTNSTDASEQMSKDLLHDYHKSIQATFAELIRCELFKLYV